VRKAADTGALAAFKNSTVPQSIGNFANICKQTTSSNLLPKNRSAFRVQPSNFMQDSKTIIQKTTSVSSQHIIDIDCLESDNPLNVTEYAQDIYQHFKQHEELVPVDPFYMESQDQINEHFRAVLVDWIVEVQHYYGLKTDTLYLTVSLIDRVLSNETVTCQQVQKGKLQLAGVACLMIASKYEDFYPPSLNELVDICDSAYTREDILLAEVIALRGLNYRISFPTAHTFLPRYLKAAQATDLITNVASYMLATTLMGYKFLQYRPSQLAAAAVFIALAHSSIDVHVWTPTLRHYTGYSSSDIVPVARIILEERAKMSSDLRSVHRVFRHQRYGGVSALAFKSTI
jgi:Cyclin, N-terminal domain/Cyclin, C-terminal domain